MNKPQLSQDIFCNFCKQETTHVCKGQSDREYDVEWIGYKFWVCAGCGHGTLEQIYTAAWQDGQEIEYFPPRRYRYYESKMFKHLPDKLAAIYKEVFHAINNELMLLCAIGIRTLLEGICAERNIQGRNLETKINNLSSILPQNIVSNLHGIRFLGNEAAHELMTPTYSELSLAIEICEDLLNFIYELDFKANNLTQMRTRRKNRGDSIF